jgi:hypothetical protein
MIVDADARRPPDAAVMCMESTEHFSMEDQMSPNPPGKVSQPERPVVGKTVINAHRPSHSPQGIAHPGEFL